MTRLEELTLNLADDAITDAECRELRTLLAEYSRRDQRISKFSRLRLVCVPNDKTWMWLSR